MISKCVEPMKVTFLHSRPHQSQTVSIFIVFGERSTNFSSILVHPNLGILLKKNILEILCRGKRLAILVSNLEGEIAKNPQEFGHVSVQIFLIIMKIRVLF